jgi:hypothetical protein
VEDFYEKILPCRTVVPALSSGSAAGGAVSGRRFCHCASSVERQRKKETQKAQGPKDEKDSEGPSRQAQLKAGLVRVQGAFEECAQCSQVVNDAEKSHPLKTKTGNLAVPRFSAFNFAVWTLLAPLAVRTACAV